MSNKRKVVLILFAGLYVLMVNVNMVQRARALAENRELAVGFDDGSCSISPAANKIESPVNATHTVLVSYPGSGKKFTWTIIEALTDYEVADDWNFSEHLNQNPLTIKSSWPHKEGTWSWTNTMDQSILLVRNPRWAIPSYQTMRFELDYAENWGESFVRIPYVYTERPALVEWENWRDHYFTTEMNKWVDFIDFWMQGGFQESTNTTHDRCLYSDMVCKPVLVIDFDTFYKGSVSTEFTKLAKALDSLENVELAATGARKCMLESVFLDKSLHNANRDGSGPPAEEKGFTVDQLEYMYNVTVDLKDKYSGPPWDEDTVAQDLVTILNSYVAQIDAEHYLDLQALYPNGSEEE